MNLLPGSLFSGALLGAVAPDIFPVVEGRNSGDQPSNVTSYEAPLPADIESGDVLVVFVSVYRNGALTVNLPSGWTRAYTQAGGSLLRAFDCFYRTATGSEGASLTVTTTAVANFASTSYRISGASGNVEGDADFADTETQPNPPNLEPTWGSKKTLWLAGCGQFSNAEPQTAPGNYSNIVQDVAVTSGLDRPRAASAERQLEASSENPGAFGAAVDGSAAEWIAATVAIESA